MSTPSYYYFAPEWNGPAELDADVCVYGGTSGGVISAVHAARRGKKAVLLVFNKKIGGMTAGGLGATDIGNKDAFGGISREFYRRVGKVYGEEESWTFEPKVAEAVLEEMLAEAGVAVYRECRLSSVETKDGWIKSITIENGLRVQAKIFVDAGYEGDLMALAGVSYTVGRESNEIYNEIYNGVHIGHPNHNFRVFVDPYKREGDPSSGLLMGISDEPAGVQGSGDDCVQAYNFRVCLTRAKNRLPFPKPENYNPDRYTLLARYINAGVWDVLGLSTAMPNGKTDTNNYGGFSSDNIGMNHAWPNADYSKRETIFQDHVSYNQGLYWFLCNDSRVPEKIRDEVRAYGLPADEFTGTGGWPHELYVREARRMVSDYVMTEHNCISGRTPDDPIALAAYQIDSHNCRRIVMGGRAYNEGNVEIRVVSPFPIAYRSIVPKRDECANLIVPFCLSASHTAFGSIRMEPVFMALGQVAAEASALALDTRSAVQDVDQATLRDKLKHEGHRYEWHGRPTDFGK